MNAYQKIALVLGVGFAVTVWIGVASLESQCDEKGGVRLRQIFGAYHCYHVASLREIK